MKFFLPIRQSLHPPKFPSIRYLQNFEANVHLLYILSTGNYITKLARLLKHSIINIFKSGVCMPQVRTPGF